MNINLILPSCMQLAWRCHKKIPYVVLLVFKEQTDDAATRMKSVTLQDLAFTLSQMIVSLF